MFILEQQVIDGKIKEFCAAQGLPEPGEISWNPIPFSGDWGISTSFFQFAALEARRQREAGGPGFNVQARAQELASAMAAHIGAPAGFTRVEAAKGYLNLYYNHADYAHRVVDTIIEQGKDFGSGTAKGERVMVEYAQPNTHHSFHIGHYRNAMLGEVLARIVQFAGFETIRASYPGDIGLGVISVVWIYAKFYQGQEPAGVHERGQWLLKLYVEASQLLEKKDNETPEQTALRESYDAERRDLYRRWDAGDPEVRALWNKTREWSLEELREILKLLDINIDVWFYESEVDEPAKAIVDELIARGIADDERPQGGAVIVKIDEKLGLKKEKYRTNVLFRGDGTTLYLTKDLALAKEKFEKYHVDRSIYVIDVRQSLHMQQTYKILELWGFKQAEKCYHLGYGFVSLPEGAMSARHGRVVLFKEVYDEAVRRVMAEGLRKNPEMPADQREAIASQVGLGALAYAMISVDNNKDTIFDWDEALNFDGHTGPYIQYAHVRATSILKKLHAENTADLPAATFTYELHPAEAQLIDLISRLPDEVQRSAAEYKPLIIANLAYDLARAFNDFYDSCPVGRAEDSVRAARLRLVTAARQVIANTLYLLGISAPDAM